MSSPRSLALALATGVVAVALAACAAPAAPGNSASPSRSAGSASASASTSASASPSATSPYGTLAVDPPGPTDAVLTITGGSAGPVSLTLAQLEALGTETVTIDEPFVKTRLTFTGVPMSAVLARAGIPAGARITTKALNDYEYADLASAFTASDAIIATRRGDAPVPFDAGGPIRIVFPDGTPLASTLDAWNWSLASISLTSGGSTA